MQRTYLRYRMDKRERPPARGSVSERRARRLARDVDALIALIERRYEERRLREKLPEALAENALSLKRRVPIYEEKIDPAGEANRPRPAAPRIRAARRCAPAEGHRVVTLVCPNGHPFPYAFKIECPCGESVEAVAVAADLALTPTDATILLGVLDAAARWSPAVGKLLAIANDWPTSDDTPI